MQSFLQYIVHNIPADATQSIKDYCFVFPNKRAGLFFQQKLVQHFGKNIWSPHIFSIVEFIEYLSDSALLESVDLVLQLYKVYQKYEPEVSFDNFYSWGQIVVKDFDEIDKYLVDAQQLFEHIKEYRDLEEEFALEEERFAYLKQFWNIINRQKDSDVKAEFLKIWQLLGKVYSDFRTELEQQHMAYEGMALRQLLEKMQQQLLDLPFKRIFFAGFNALNVAEKKLLDYFTQYYDTLVFWDTDTYYMNDEQQEAGKFLRQYYAQWKDHPKHHWHSQTAMENQAKHVYIVGVPQKIGQAQYIGQVLQQHEDGEIRPAETSVVLGDETLLFPMLYALPPKIDSVNITMGYPLKATPLFYLLENIVNLQKTAIKPEQEAENKNWLFYSRTLIELLNNPYIKFVDEPSIQKLLNYIHRRNKVYLYENTLREQLPHPIFQLILRPLPNFLALSECFNAVLKTLYELLTSPNEEDSKPDDEALDANNLKAVEMATQAILSPNAIDAEFVHHALKQLRRLDNTFKRYREQVGLEMYWRLYREMIQTTKINFTGEPIAGLQVMGFLETRLLDFKNLFIAGMNEGIIPTTGQHNTFIPNTLRRAFAMPPTVHQDDIDAYHFYRILQRAERVWLIYNTETDKTGEGERSRFVLQIQEELKVRCPNVQIQHLLVTAPLVVATPLPPIAAIEKSDEIIEILLQKYAEMPTKENDSSPMPLPKLTPSSLSQYITHPIEFYFKYVAALRPLDELEEIMSPATIGKVLHTTIEYLYQPRQGKEVTRDYIASVLQNSDLIRRKLVAALRKNDFEHHQDGNNLLFKNVIEQWVKGILTADLQEAPFQIIGLETDDFATLLPLPDGKKIRLSGSIDRLDKKTDENGQVVVRVLDYKTGNVRLVQKPEKLKLSYSEYLNDYFENSDYKAGFQIYLYAYLYWLQNPQTPIIAGIYSTQQPNKEVIYARKGEVLNAEFFAEFEQRLKSMISEIFDTQQPFTMPKKDHADLHLLSPYAQLLS